MRRRKRSAQPNPGTNTVTDYDTNFDAIADLLQLDAEVEPGSGDSNDDTEEDKTGLNYDVYDDELSLREQKMYFLYFRELARCILYKSTSDVLY